MFNIIQDTQEKQPWQFDSVAIGGVIHQKLPTGDYTVEGYEDILCIERKKSVSEFATNCTEKRFEKELVRMAKFKYPFLVFEFDMNDVQIYPMGSSIPRSKWRKIKTRGPYMMKRMSEIMVKHKIPIFMAGSAENAANIAVSLMKRIVE